MTYDSDICTYTGLALPEGPVQKISEAPLAKEAKQKQSNFFGVDRPCSQIALGVPDRCVVHEATQTRGAGHSFLDNTLISLYAQRIFMFATEPCLKW